MLLKMCEIPETSTLTFLSAGALANFVLCMKPTDVFKSARISQL